MSVQKLRDALGNWIDDHEWDDFLTVNFNCQSTVLTAKAQFGKLCQRLDRHLLGSRYLKRPAERTFIIGFPEHISSNFHIHCLTKYNCIRHGSRSALEGILQHYWKELVPSGTIHLQEAYDAAGAARYSTKEFGSYDRFDDIIFPGEFWSESTRQDHDSVNWNRLQVLKRRAEYANYERQRRGREPRSGETPS